MRASAPRGGSLFAVGLFVLLTGHLAAAPRDVQIRSVNFATGVVELFNFGRTDESLGGWRFCTHDENEALRYSGFAGLNGVTIEAGTSFFIHFNNDAPGGSDSINRSTVGSFALPLDAEGAYGMALYFPPVVFSSGAQIADHLQWSTGGADNDRADERSDEAERGGVWRDQSRWIATGADTVEIVLTDETGGVLHGPEDYQVRGPAPNPRLVQINSIDIERGVIELFNFGDRDQSLAGWSFCSHDDDEARLYTFTGLDDVVIEARTRFSVHLRDDAPDGPDAANASALGQFAGPLDAGPYSLALYFPPLDFDDGRQIADHVQWSPGGVNDDVASERSDEAETGGVWRDRAGWVSTTETTVRLQLLDETGAELHGPDDYRAIEPPPDCNGNGVDDTLDLSSGTSADCNGNGVPDECDLASGSSADENGDGVPDECEDATPFRRGDANDSGVLDIADASFIFIFLFLGGPGPGCREAANANADANLDLSDGIYNLTFLFLGGPPPPPPGQTCGAPPEEGLGCDIFESCQ